VTQVAVDSGVRRLVYASTLRMFQSYPDDVYLTEFWKPRQSTDIAEIATYLGETTVREFTRCNLVTGTALRLSELVV